MSKTFTNSLALLNQMKTQFDSNREINKESRTIETKGYGSIKRSQVGTEPARQSGPGTYTRNNQKYVEDSELRERF